MGSPKQMRSWRRRATQTSPALADATGSSRESAVNLLPASLRAAMTGSLGGAMAALLLLSIAVLQHMLWGAAINIGLAPLRSPLWCLAVPTGTGLVLSLIGAHKPTGRLPELSETLAALQRQPADGNREPNVQARAVLHQALAGALAVVGGGSLGPEALVSHAVVALSRWIWRGRDQAVASAALSGSLGFFGTPLAGPIALAGRHTSLLWRWLPGTLAGITGFMVFQGLRGLGGGLQAVPFEASLLNQSPLTGMLAALAGGAVGCGCGQALHSWRQWLGRLSARHSAALAPVLTGFTLGLAQWRLPLAAMSGEHQLQPLLLGQWGLTPVLLCLSGVLKLLLTGLCLETGWRGGLIFPVLTGSTAIGLGLHQLLPAFGQAGIWFGSVAGGCLGTLLPSPLLALVLGLVLLNGHGAEAMLIGLLLSQILRHHNTVQER